jgi:hypothetical protein
MPSTGEVCSPIRILRTEEGGSRRRLRSDYHATAYLGPGESRSGNDGIPIIARNNTYAPRNGGIAEIRFLDLEPVRDVLKVGAPLELKERPRIITKGTITGLLSE